MKILLTALIDIKPGELPPRIPGNPIMFSSTISDAYELTDANWQALGMVHAEQIRNRLMNERVER